MAFTRSGVGGRTPSRKAPGRAPRNKALSRRSPSAGRAKPAGRAAPKNKALSRRSPVAGRAKPGGRGNSARRARTSAPMASASSPGATKYGKAAGNARPSVKARLGTGGARGRGGSGTAHTTAAQRANAVTPTAKNAGAAAKRRMRGGPAQRRAPGKGLGSRRANAAKNAAGYKKMSSSRQQKAGSPGKSGGGLKSQLSSLGLSKSGSKALTSRKSPRARPAGARPRAAGRGRGGRKKGGLMSSMRSAASRRSRR